MERDGNTLISYLAEQAVQVLTAQYLVLRHNENTNTSQVGKSSIEYFQMNLTEAISVF